MNTEIELTHYDILNPTVDIELGKAGTSLGVVKVKARKIGFGAVLADAEAHVVSARIAQAREAASGIDKADRTEFLLAALDSIPAGRKLYEAAMTNLQSPDGTIRALYCCLKDGSGKAAIQYDEFSKLVWQTDPADIKALVHLLCEM